MKVYVFVKYTSINHYYFNRKTGIGEFRPISIFYKFKSGFDKHACGEPGKKNLIPNNMPIHLANPILPIQSRIEWLSKHVTAIVKDCMIILAGHLFLCDFQTTLKDNLLKSLGTWNPPLLSWFY